MILRDVMGINEKELMKYARKRHTKSWLKWLKWKKKTLAFSEQCREEFKGDITRCDVLLVHLKFPDDKHYGRNKKLISRLGSLDLTIEETFELDEKRILEHDLTCGPYESDELFKIYEGYANYLKKKYKPKIIIRERSGSLLSPFLKGRKAGDPVTLQLTHCVLMSGTSRNTMMDFNYFSLYGPSSLEYLRKLKNMYGECKIIYGGSYLFDENFSLNKPSSEAPIVFLGMGPQLERTKKGLKIYRLVADWQKKYNRKLLA